MTDLDFEDPFAAPKAPQADTPAPNTPKMALDFADPFERAPAAPRAAVQPAEPSKPEQFARSLGGATLRLVSDIPFAAGGLAGAVGAKDTADTLFRTYENAQEAAKQVEGPAPTSVGGRVATALGALPTGVVSLGANSLVQPAADVVKEDGSLGEAYGQLGLNTAANAAGVAVGGLGKTLAQRVTQQGLASGALGEGARVAGNAMRGPDQQQEFDPVELGLNVGAGVGFGLMPHGNTATHEPAPSPVADASGAPTAPGAAPQPPADRTAAPRAPVAATPLDAAIIAQRQNPSGPLGTVVAGLRTSAESAGGRADTFEPQTGAPHVDAGGQEDQHPLANAADNFDDAQAEPSRNRAHQNLPGEPAGAVPAQRGEGAGTLTREGGVASELPAVEGSDRSNAPQDLAANGRDADASPQTESDVGISNAAKAAERARRNLGPIDAEGKRDFGTVWERARETLAADPQAGNRLTNEVAAKPRALNAEESAVLIQHGADLNNRYDATLRDIEAAQKSGDRAAEAQAQVRRRELEEQLAVHDQAARQSGYEQGLGLAMRQQLAKRDYSMARQVARFRAIEGGDIPAGVRAELDRLTGQIADLNEQIRARDERVAKNAAKNQKGRAPKSAEQAHADLMAKLSALVGTPARAAAGEPEAVALSRGAAQPARAEGGMRRDALAGAIGDTVRSWRGDAPRVLVHQSHDTAPDSMRRAPGFDRNVEGAYDARTGTVHLFADAIRTPQRGAQVLAHEVIGHYGVEGVLGDRWGKFVADVNAMRKSAPATMRDIFAEVERRYRNATPEAFAAETMAVMAERGTTNALMDRVIAAVRQFLRSIGFNAKFSDAELRQMLVAAHERVAGAAPGRGQRAAALPAFSKADPTNSPAFRDWFGRSKVTDATGRPRLIFHGTGDEFTVFAKDRAGAATAHATAPLGHFFTADRALAERYAENASEGVPANKRLVDAYLRIEKPYELTLREAQAIESPAEARALRAKLERAGYDGIHIGTADSWVPFESEQIKSASTNRGTFDLTNPDIRFSQNDERQQKVAALVKEMGRARVANGETNPRALIDWLHGQVGSMTGLSRQQIHEIVAGVREPGAKATRSELQQRLAAIRSQLRQEQRNPEQQRNATRQATLQRQIADIERRIETRDFSKTKREPFTYNEKTFGLEVQRNRAQRQLDALALKREQAQKNPVARFSDFLVKLHRFNILSSPLVVPKLLSAATAKIAVTPLEEMAGAVLRHIPGIKGVAAMAPRHGGGFSLGAEREALRGAFSRETLQSARDQIRHGHDALDELYGDKAYKTEEWTNFMGNIHSALKAPAMLNEFYRSYFQRAQHERARVIGEGLSPEQADAYMQRPSTQAMIGAKAYADGAAAKMQGKNQLADAIDSALRTAKQQGGPMGALAKLIDVVFPIKKVPLNIVKEITSYAAGGAKAAIGAVTWRGELTPERADYILKNLKQQTVGTALLALGYAFSQYFGGTHQEGDAKRNPKVKPGEAEIAGVHVPELFFHSPAAQTVQIGAGLARIYRQEFGKTGHGFDAGLHALLANYGSTLERGVPYLDTPRRIGNTVKYGRGAGEVVGDQLRSMFVPQVVQRVAQATDPFTGFRKPQSVAQDVALGIPGLREKVPK